MLKDNTLWSMGELLKMIRKSWDKFVITTRGEDFNSQNLPRKWSHLRYYATYDVIKILAHVEYVFRNVSTPVNESSDMYEKIMIPPLLWTSNKPHAYGFYTLEDDAIFMYVDSDVMLIMNKDVAFVKDSNNTIHRYGKKICIDGEILHIDMNSEYNIIANRVLKVIEQFDKIIGAELRFFKFIS
ncbi:MAG: hypothetical protein QXT13_10540 [Pyrobaculum sp.]